MAGIAAQRELEAAVAHHRAQRLGDAERIYRDVLARFPDHVETLRLLGILSTQVGRGDMAVELLGKAIALAPGNFACHYHLANAHLAMGGIGGIDAAVGGYQRALAIDPGDADAHSNLGSALIQKGMLDEAIASLRRALEINPDFADAHGNLGGALMQKGMPREAIACYERAMEIRPDHAPTHSALVFTCHFSPDYDAARILGEAQRWNERHARPLKGFIQPHDNTPDPGRRLRVGYLSPDFRNHPVGLNVLPLLRAHDRERFEICCYAVISRPDAITREFRGCADRWREVAGYPDERLADQIREDGIDILVDLAMHMSKGRLLVMARRPAPVQVAFAAYPGTTGLDAIDYRLTDPHLDPPGRHDEFYSERSLRLPDCFWCYDPLTTEPAVNILPALSSGRITFGSLNNYCKVNAPLLRLWARVLRAVPESGMLILSPPGDHRAGALEVFGDEGIDPGRVEWVTQARRPEYLRGYHRIDIGLDPDPYNGHTTSLDSFWMGVPVVTLVGKTVAGRAGLCQARNLGLEELVAWTPEEYVQRAVALAADLPRLAQMRAMLRERIQRSPLMDGARFARNVESAYREMWQRWCESRRGELLER